MSVDHLVAWLRSEGARVDPGVRIEERPGRGHCLVWNAASAATVPVVDGGGRSPAMSPVLSIPRRCILTPGVALADPALGPALRRVTRDPGPRGQPPLALAWAPIVWLARQRFAVLKDGRDVSSCLLGPWVDALPQAFPEFPLNWDADEAACLAGTPLLDALRVLAASLADALVRVREALAEGQASAPEEAWLNESNLRWATCCFWSRVLGLPADEFSPDEVGGENRQGGQGTAGGVVLAMVPMLDFANHVPVGGTATWSVERQGGGGAGGVGGAGGAGGAQGGSGDEDAAAVLWVHHTTPDGGAVGGKGQNTGDGVELTFSYGEEKVNDVLLLSYGFLDGVDLNAPPDAHAPPGPSDAVYLPLDALDVVLTQEDPGLASAKVATIRQLTNCLRLYPLHAPTSAALVTAVLTPEALGGSSPSLGSPDPLTRKRAESVEQWLLEGVVNNLQSAAIEFEPGQWLSLPRNVRVAVCYKAGVTAAALAALTALKARASAADTVDL